MANPDQSKYFDTVKKKADREGLQVIKAQQAELWFSLTGPTLEEWSLHILSIIVKVFEN